MDRDKRSEERDKEQKVKGDKQGERDERVKERN